MVYNGFWFSPERHSLQKMVDSIQDKVTGRVRLKLYKGQVYPLGRQAESSLYDPKLATFEAEDTYDQADAEGFIRLQGLRLVAEAKSRSGEK
ncbi:MAG: argininosuccinate synthase, partial [Desulfohalobiaceae bacterium]